jgi:lactam utilization protein B
MTTTINLNADLGEDFGAYKVIPHRVQVAATARIALEQAGVEVVTLPKTTFA